MGEAARRTRRSLARIRRGASPTRQLTDERVELVNRQPELVDHRHAPVDEANAVADVDRRLAELGDLGDLAARVEHARRLEQSARQRFEDLVRNNRDELHASRVPEGEALVDAYREAGATLVAVAEQLLGFAQRSQEIEAICGFARERRVPIDEASRRLREAREIAASTPPVPLP